MLLLDAGEVELARPLLQRAAAGARLGGRSCGARLRWRAWTATGPRRRRARCSCTRSYQAPGALARAATVSFLLGDDEAGWRAFYEAAKRFEDFGPWAAALTAHRIERTRAGRRGGIRRSLEEPVGRARDGDAAEGVLPVQCAAGGSCPRARAGGRARRAGGEAPGSATRGARHRLCRLQARRARGGGEEADAAVFRRKRASRRVPAALPGRVPDSHGPGRGGAGAGRGGAQAGAARVPCPAVRRPISRVPQAAPDQALQLLWEAFIALPAPRSADGACRVPAAGGLRAALRLVAATIAIAACWWIWLAASSAPGRCRGPTASMRATRRAPTRPRRPWAWPCFLTPTPSICETPGTTSASAPSRASLPAIRSGAADDAGGSFHPASPSRTARLPIDVIGRRPRQSQGLVLRILRGSMRRLWPVGTGFPWRPPSGLRAGVAVSMSRQGTRAGVLLACVLLAPLAAWPHATQLSSSRMELTGNSAGVLLELNGRDLEVALHTALTAPTAWSRPSGWMARRPRSPTTCSSMYGWPTAPAAPARARSSRCARGASMCWRRCAGVARRSPARSSTGSRCSTRSIRRRATWSRSAATCGGWPCSATVRRKRVAADPCASPRGPVALPGRGRRAHRHRAASTSPSSSR